MWETKNIINPPPPNDSISDCARARRENARARENARDPHENARALHENDCARGALQPNSD